MAYAALASLARAIEQILPQDQDYAFLCSKDQMKSLQEQVVLLKELLDYISIHSFSPTVDDLPEIQIRDVAYKLEDIIEPIICTSLGQVFKSDAELLTLNVFSGCVNEVGDLLKKATKTKKVLEWKKNIPKALTSLAQAIDEILPQDEDYAFLCGKEKMKSLHGKIILLRERIENVSGKSRSSTISVPKNRITDVVYQLDDIMESIRCRSSLAEECQDEIDTREFCRCFKEVDVLLLEVMEMEKNLENKDTSTTAIYPLTTTNLLVDAPGEKDANVVGIGDNLLRILDQITGGESNLTIIPITGMGGIGKTTLARAVYEHQTTVKYFHPRVWVTVSAEFCIDDIFREILLANKQTEVPKKNLSDSVYRVLLEHRYLIVLDDMWHNKVWDGVKRAFPKGKKGSRVIVTTRQLEVAKYVANSSDIHEMQLLNEDDSWKLLRKNVYGKDCPIDFEDIGRAISKNCKGLPLAIVIVGGMLKFNKTEEYWKEIAKSTKEKTASDSFNKTEEYWKEIAKSTKEKTASDSKYLIEILSLSYTNLPYHLKACFLYMGAFKEDYEISTKEIAMIWTAEGFLQKPKEYRTMEEIAEECLEKLVERNLVMVTKRGYNGKIKSSSVHDLLREVSLIKSREEKFLHHFTDEEMNEVSFRNIIKVQRRVSFSTHKLFELPYDSNDDTPARSVLNKYPMSPRLLSIIPHFHLLRLLYKVLIEDASNLSILFRLTNLRYLHIVRKFIQKKINKEDPDFKDKYSYSALEVPESIYNLQNLETLIFSGTLHAGEDRYELVLPSEIWKMPCLRHIILFHKSNLPSPSLDVGYPVLENLQTLSWVTNFDFSKDAIEKIPNVKKLGVAYRIIEKNDKQQFHLDNLIHLHKLEELAVWCDYAGPQRTRFAFPENLKKLSLERTGIPWKDMSIVGSLPRLEKLKLKWHSVTGKVWKLNEGEFRSLKYLKMDDLRIQDWIAESKHFPKLETLIIVSCGQLMEVPSKIGEIDTLKMLIVKDCKYIVDSVNGIQEEQNDYGNTDLVNVSDDEDFLPDLF